jgi:hypothetical protein
MIMTVYGIRSVKSRLFVQGDWDWDIPTYLEWTADAPSTFKAADEARHCLGQTVYFYNRGASKDTELLQASDLEVVALQLVEVPL